MSSMQMETRDGYIKHLSGRSDRSVLMKQYKLLKINIFKERKNREMK